MILMVSHHGLGHGEQRGDTRLQDLARRLSDDLKSRINGSIPSSSLRCRSSTPGMAMIRCTGKERPNQFSIWVTCKKCGLRLSRGGHGETRTLGAPPEHVQLAQQELAQIYDASEMNEKIMPGKINGDQGTPAPSHQGPMQCKAGHQGQRPSWQGTVGAGNSYWLHSRADRHSNNNWDSFNRGTNTGISYTGADDTDKDNKECVAEPINSISGTHCRGQGKGSSDILRWRRSSRTWSSLG